MLGQPADPDGNPDTSFLAKIPADTAFTFQTLDKRGMALNYAQTWHQVRPGEIRNNCGGCHAHSQQPTPFEKTAAAKPDYKVWDLTTNAPRFTTKANDRSGQKWDKDGRTGVAFAGGVLDVEFHRDIKPSNVNVQSNGSIKLLDFGLARMVRAETMTLSGAIMGTPPYMAPEQFEGRLPEPTMDVFAVGVFLFEILTGRRPFINVPVAKRMRERAPAPSAVIPGLARWDALIGCCLEINPKARFANIGALSTAINKALRPIVSALLAALDLLGPWDGGRSASGEQHLAIIDEIVTAAENPRSGELALRFAYTLAAAERLDLKLVREFVLEENEWADRAPHPAHGRGYLFRP